MNDYGDNVRNMNKGPTDNGGSSNYEREILQRLTRVETKIETLATKEDIANFKADIYKGLWASLVVAVVVAVVGVTIKIGLS